MSWRLGSQLAPRFSAEWVDATMISGETDSNIRVAWLKMGAAHRRTTSWRAAFIYIDGSHQAPDVLADSVLAFQLLRVGGIMIFDDYLWRMEPEGRQDSLNIPKPAIDSFINIFQRKLRVVSGFTNYQLYIEKTFS
jgi:Methyltransferase domain